jgi:hypothetical protein
LHLLLHRAIKNAGDFLIHERATRLLQAFRPDVRLVSAPGWLSLDEEFPAEALAEFDSIIICGGPGYQDRLESRVYPLLGRSPLPVPVVLLALGTYLFPGAPSQVTGHRFHPRTLAVLATAGAAPSHLGARDVLTERLLRAQGLDRVLMTGDPAWYDLDTIDQSMPRLGAVRSVAFTPPASRLFDLQAELLMRSLATRFEDARGTVVFHRGEQPHYAALADAVGWDTIDIQGSSRGLAIYDRTDVHVGYRLHAHLYSLSHARPTYLVAEDSRSRGALQTLGSLGVDPLVRRDRSWRAMRATRSAIERAPFPRRLADLARAAMLPDISPAVIGQLEADVTARFERHEHARQVIRSTLPVMRQMIESIP